MSDLAALETMDDDMFEQYALETLERELGTAGRDRFLRMLLLGRGDYTNDRAVWLDQASLEHDVDALHKKQAA